MVADTEKEVRFTRSHQAVAWWLTGVVLVTAALACGVAAFLPAPWGVLELRPFWWVLLIFLLIAVLCFRVAFRCLKHAYLIFSPIGVEIFPFKKPEANLDVVAWAEIDHLEIRNHFLFLHFNQEETSGKAISLKPISRKKWEMVERIAELRSKKRSNT